MPVFAVSTEKDHVAPWKSVYKLHLMLNTDLTFVLTNGDHNAGIISEPGHPGRSYRISHRNGRSSFVSPEDWLTATKEKQDSWWKAWHLWLVKNSSPSKVKPPILNPDLPPAPGTYVFQK